MSEEFNNNNNNNQHVVAPERLSLVGRRHAVLRKIELRYKSETAQEGGAAAHEALGLHRGCLDRLLALLSSLHLEGSKRVEEERQKRATT